MTLPADLTTWLDQQNWGAVVAVRPIGGGCINNARRLETQNGPPTLLKTNPTAPAGMFPAEAAGLRALATAGAGPRIPAVYAASPTWILIEFLAAGPRQPEFGATLGQQLAALHQTHAATFGFETDNYIGSTPQPNPRLTDGYTFFAEHRLRFQAQLAVQRHLLTAADAQRIDRLCDRLPDLLPPQPAALIHGDLWGGNVITGPAGEPALIDPAAHYGWPEAELAMTALFGGFDRSFYAAYDHHAQLAPGYRDRFDLYNLYHLLNHLNLFGGGYHGAVMTILHRYT